MRPTLSLTIQKGVGGYFICTHTRCFIHELPRYLSACAADRYVTDLKVWYPSGQMQCFSFTYPNEQEDPMDWRTAIVRTLEALAYACVVGLGFRFIWIAWQEKKVRR